MKKKLISLILAAAVLCLGAVGCGTTSGESGGQSSSAGNEVATNTDAAYTIRVAMATAGANPQNIAAEAFKTELEAISSDITVELYPAGQLGTISAVLQNVQDGTLEATFVPASYLEAFAPAAAICDLPNSWTGEELYIVLNNDECLMADYLYSKGFTTGGWFKLGDRVILSTKEVKSMADLKGLKLWCLPSTTLQEELKAYGAVPSVMDPGDVAVSVQNGAVDGAETDVSFILPQGLYESAKYITNVPGSAIMDTLIFSSDWLETLPADVQEMILTAAESATKAGQEYATTFADEAVATLKEKGVTFSEPSADFVAGLEAASAPIIEKYKSDKDCAEMYENFASLLGK